jgi:hypothetical protein
LRREAALARKKPVERMSFSSSPGGAFAKACALGYFLKRVLVTWLTRASVHCADRMVATRSCSGVAKSNSQCARGYSFFSPAMILAA